MQLIAIWLMLYTQLVIVKFQVLKGEKLLAERLRKLRNTLGLTQEQFAKELGVSFATVNRYEKGKRAPDAEFFQVLVDRYKVNLNWLFTGKGPMFLVDSAKQADSELFEILSVLSPERQRDLVNVLREISEILCKQKDGK